MDDSCSRSKKGTIPPSRQAATRAPLYILPTQAGDSSPLENDQDRLGFAGWTEAKLVDT